LAVFGRESPFEGAPASVLELFRSVWVSLAKAAAVHEDFTALVTRENPARAGEMLHLYMTGLGPVVPAVKTGEAAPANPPSAAVTPLVCDLDGIPADVLFAGLAPGFVGYYQVSLRLPIHLPGGVDMTLSCSADGHPGGISFRLPVEAN
jgi:uncharacterized protein (TIGR03437 family)